jgi:hypothetical protein
VFLDTSGTPVCRPMVHIHSHAGNTASNGIPSHLNILVSQMFPFNIDMYLYMKTLHTIQYIPHLHVFRMKNPNPHINATSC